MRHLVLAALVLISPLATPAVQAQPEAWNWVEFRVPLSANQAWWGPRALRFTAEDNGFQLPGSGQMLVRIGPVWDLTPNLAFGMNLTNAADPLGGFSFGRETTFEAEPTLHADFGGATLSYRNRLEYRLLPEGQRWRDRNQLRFNYRFEGTPWMPFAWEEAFFDLSGAGFNENRAALGIGFQANSTVRIDVGVLLHTQLVSTGAANFSSDPAANVVLVLTPPTPPF